MLVRVFALPPRMNKLACGSIGYLHRGSPTSRISLSMSSKGTQHADSEIVMLLGSLVRDLLLLAF